MLTITYFPSYPGLIKFFHASPDQFLLRFYRDRIEPTFLGAILSTGIVLTLIGPRFIGIQDQPILNSAPF